MKAELWTNHERGTFRGVVVSQMNLQADVPLVGTSERVTVHIRCGSQQYCVLDTADISSAFDGKMCFQMVLCSSAESGDLHMEHFVFSKKLNCGAFPTNKCGL